MARILDIANGKESTIFSELAETCDKVSNSMTRPTICFIHEGDHYCAYGDSAENLHNELRLPIIYYGKIAYSDIAINRFDVFSPVLIKKGWTLAIIENNI